MGHQSGKRACVLIQMFDQLHMWLLFQKILDLQRHRFVFPRHVNPGNSPATYVKKPILCAGVTTYTALQISIAKPGQWVVISGAGGGLGHIAVQLSSRGMAHRVIGIDDGFKKKLVIDCGAPHFIDVKEHDDESIAAEVMKLTGGLVASAAIVCTSKNRAYHTSKQ